MKTLKSGSFILLILLQGILSFCSKDESTTPQVEIELGAFYQGGVIFYLDETQEHGLIVSIVDQSTSAVWCENVDDIPGAEGTSIGSGLQNTQDIVNGCSSNSAAAICYNLTLNGYDDWYLPSQLELAMIVQNKAVVDAAASQNGGTNFASDVYWSSTELDLGSKSSAVTYSFETDNLGFLTKFGTARVRAIRSF